MPYPGFVALLRQHVRSVWDVELLLLMRAAPDRAWSADDLVRELRASAPLVADALRRLGEAGLVAEDAGGLRYAPAGPDLERFCETLAEAYRTRPVTVINLIASPSRVQGLADAFKFKGDRE